MMRWLRAPLLHFVAGGAALFWLVHGSHPPAAPVVVTAEDVSRLRLDYTRETGLEPTAADEAALVERAVEEELLFREAVARGLDQHDRSVRNWLVEQMRTLSDDPTADDDRLYAGAHRLGLDRTDLVVRRILVQKMRLLAARSGVTRPGDADLDAFYTKHRDEYRSPDRVSFWQVFLASTEHGGSTVTDAGAKLARFRRQALRPEEAARQGDAFAIPPHVIEQSPAQVEKLFGAELATTVQRAEMRTWVGPVASPYGLHLVWIEARSRGTSPPFDVVRERVLERWQDEQRTRRVAELVRDLEQRYPMRIESAAWRQRSPS